MEGIRRKPSTPSVVLFALIYLVVVTTAIAQGTPAELTGEALHAHLHAQLELLDSPQFRARELASWRLQQYPFATIELIAKSAPQATANSALRQIALLDRFLSHSNSEIKSAAYDVLKKFSLTRTSALGSMAANSVKAIEDSYEMQAFEILQNAGASFGYTDLININVLRPRTRRADQLGLAIKSDSFRGDSEVLSWIRYLKRIEVVSLEGVVITPEMLAQVAQMPQVKKIVLRGTVIKPGVYQPTLQPTDLLVLNQLAAIEHLEINYMSIDDSFVPILCQLPLTESLRLFGTAISEAGKKEIARRLDGLEIYRGNGGFLGIGADPTGPVVVGTVQSGSAAENAGIKLGDTITEIQGEAINNFSDLRATIAKYSPNETVLVKLNRPKPPNVNGQRIGFFELQLFVVLNEQAN